MAAKPSLILRTLSGIRGVLRVKGFVLLPGRTVELSGFVHPVAGAIDMDNDGMMDHPVHHGRGDHRIAQVVAQLLKVNVGGHDC